MTNDDISRQIQAMRYLYIMWEAGKIDRPSLKPTPYMSFNERRRLAALAAATDSTEEGLRK